MGLILRNVCNENETMQGYLDIAVKKKALKSLEVTVSARDCSQY